LPPLCSALQAQYTKDLSLRGNHLHGQAGRLHLQRRGRGVHQVEGTKPVRTSFRSPWQNGTAERWIGNCRRELLAHVVVFGERHLVPACEVVHQLLPQGSLPLGTRQRHAGRETDHAATVTHGQGRGVAESGWPSPSLRVVGSCVAPFRWANVPWPEAVTVLAFRSSSPQST